MTKPAKKQRILVVDDSAENIDILVSLFKDDYMVAAARDGEKSLKMAEKNPPDLILLDIIMPGMDGYEVCRKLKENEITRNIPVIFITALSEALDEAKAFGIGAVDFISKPYQFFFCGTFFFPFVNKIIVAFSHFETQIQQLIFYFRRRTSFTVKDDC